MPEKTRFTQPCTVMLPGAGTFSDGAPAETIVTVTVPWAVLPHSSLKV
jgi:hypothetical protein